MNQEKSIKLFEEKTIRTHWDEDAEKWYFSVVDVVSVLTDSIDPAAYWRKLKQRLIAEGNETVTNCHGLKMRAADGKMRLTDIADHQQLLRLIQSIPSKKAEPFKLWLARVGSERIDETADPELAIDRALETYLRKGYSRNWINQRLKTIEVRKELTDEWEEHGISSKQDFAILTDEITRTWSGKTTRQYKAFKGLKKESLRDNMSNVELVLNMLAEVATTDITRQEDPATMPEHKQVARRGGSVAKAARLQYETQTGKAAVTPLNARILKALPDQDGEKDA
ncbi:phage antirepressor [Betaproteobacteria bacterium]|nr:phage antirepressor [Betaproteobacteria bacterium]GHU24704.1 phage antirepressor [Betaproteobacteria bacterium]GHU42227.1 phage antirepressor [Betaproteobacteria bacterium]